MRANRESNDAAMPVFAGCWCGVVCDVCDEDVDWTARVDVDAVAADDGVVAVGMFGAMLERLR